MAKRPSLDALLTPSLRVSRPVAACSRCRAAKTKCDGKLPACTACERSGRARYCSGAHDEFAKGKERSYVAALEAALMRLQRRVAEARTLHATEPGRRDSQAASCMLGPGHPFHLRKIVASARTHQKEASDVDNLVGDFGFLSLNATSRDFHGFTPTMSFARLLRAASQTGDLPQTGTRALPGRHTIAPLVQHYLDNIFVLVPFFSETDFMASFSAVYADAGRCAKAFDHWMVWMVLAIVASNSSREKEDENHRLAQEHVSAALVYAEDVLHPGSIAGIQAILFLVQYSMLDPDSFSCWHLIGFASRVMVDLGLHNEPAAEVPISKDEIEIRRRVFHCVYTLERNISMALDRAFSFTDDSASVELPAISRPTHPLDPGRSTSPQLFLRSLQPSLYLIDIRRVQSTLYQETHSSNRSAWSSSTASVYTSSIVADIRSWFSSVPDALQQSQLIFFRLEALYSQIFALAPSCRIPNITELSRTLIFEYAIQYVDVLDPITRDNRSHPFFSITDVHRLYFIGCQLLNALWASFDSLLSGAMPHESPVSTPEANGSTSESASATTPNISRPTSALENCMRAIRCLQKTTNILVYAHSRFGTSCASIRTNFEQESAVVMNKLVMKQQELGTVQYITGGPPQQQQQQQQQQPPPPPPPPTRQQMERPTLPPIGWPPGVPIPPPEATSTPALPEDYSRAPVWDFEIRAAQQPLPPVPQPLSVPALAHRDHIHQQDLMTQPPRDEGLPPFRLTLGLPGYYGPMGPYHLTIPPGSPGNSLSMPETTPPGTGGNSMGTGEHDNADENGAAGAG
jgi:Fungal specific transcription factor domain/Fungal Zn(2)-Cys(6) binuclear cluster domain